MTDRDVIVQAIDPTGTRWDDAIVYELADAVLAAIGDRLLPELPPYDVLEVMVGDAGEANVRFRHYRERSFAYGTGTTIPAAIRAALESQP